MFASSVSASPFTPFRFAYLAYFVVMSPPSVLCPLQCPPLLRLDFQPFFTPNQAMSNALSDLSVAQLTRALELREQIDALKTELDGVGLLGGGVQRPGDEISVSPKGRKRFSAASRRKMAAAQRARWAAKRGEEAGTAEPARKKRKKMSKAAKAALSAAAKARWKKAKAAGKTRL